MLAIFSDFLSNHLNFFHLLNDEFLDLFFHLSIFYSVSKVIWVSLMKIWKDFFWNTLYIININVVILIITVSIDLFLSLELGKCWNLFNNLMELHILNVHSYILLIYWSKWFSSVLVTFDIFNVINLLVNIWNLRSIIMRYRKPDHGFTAQSVKNSSK